MTIQTLRQFRRFCGLIVLATLPILGAAQAPAMLPFASSVPQSAPLPIDGSWTISTLNKRIRIEAGRAYAIDPWVHLMLWQIQSDMVVIQDMRSTGPGQFAGYDLPLLGSWKASLQRDGRMRVNVAGSLGPVSYVLRPEVLDDPAAFDAARFGQDHVPDDTPGHEPPPQVLPPPVLPGPPTPPIAIIPPRSKPRPVPGDITPGCGGEGQAPCKNTPARVASAAQKLGCPGKNMHFSPRNGGECWSCPRGYKRTAQFIKGKKACAKKFFVGPYKRATYQRSVWGCPKNQFHVARNGGQCMSCPAGYKRVAAAGVDTMMCHIENKYRCDKGLKVAKRPPDDNPLTNLLGLHKSKVCGLPFNITKEAGRDVKRMATVHFALKKLRVDLVAPTNEARAFRRALKNKNWQSAWQWLQKLPSFQRIQQVAQETQHGSITVGLSGDIQAIVGSNVELGLAINANGTGGIKPYRTAGFSKGLAIGLDGGVTVGLWRNPVPQLAGPSQGVAVSVGGAVSGGAGVWYSYYTPQTRGQDYMGMTVSGGAGLGVEIGEYNEVWTEML